MRFKRGPNDALGRTSPAREDVLTEPVPTGPVKGGDRSYAETGEPDRRFASATDRAAEPTRSAWPTAGDPGGTPEAAGRDDRPDPVPDLDDPARIAPGPADPRFPGLGDPPASGAPDLLDPAPAPTTGTGSPRSPWLGRARAAVASRLDRVSDRFHPTHWPRQAAGSVRGHWRRSLQLRVATLTLIGSTLVVVIVGMLLLSQIASGLLEPKERAAMQETRAGLRYATQQLNAIDSTDPESLSTTIRETTSSLALGGSSVGLFDVALLAPDDPLLSRASGSDPIDIDSIPDDLRALVDGGDVGYAYTRIARDSGSTGTGLVVGGPVVSDGGGRLSLFYVFPMRTEEKAVDLVRRTVLAAGSAVVLLVAGVSVLVTRLVVRPVRQAAQTATRLAEGHLEERMRITGEDELSLLATRFNQMADSLQRQITKLEEMSRLQRQFTSDVSHELRTPLSTVRMAADVLYAARDGFNPEDARSTELLHAELGRFETLLADLLEISRYDAGAAVLDAEPVDLRTVVRRVVEATGSLAAHAGSEVIPELPSVPVIAEVDPRRVERILRNLIGNAIQHGQGGPIEVTLAGDAHAVAVAVRDHGVGLAPGEAALVFNRFWRADPARDRARGGTGLGLAISLEDARLHSGWLHAWGRPGDGSRFRLTLPRRSNGPLTRSPLPLAPPGVDDPAEGVDR